MTDVYRSNRKVTDSEIVRLNSVGLSLATIARKLGCHTSTITQRLHSLNVMPADTRRAFMESIYLSLSHEQQVWLEARLGPHTPVKQFVRDLIVEKFMAERGDSNVH